ncbi:MAG: hypothetical protein A3A58_00805 [Candidatus Blackburnbacteria bacterium RIFCSPLOWO2_01_FULL_41_27]|uniref:Uncharacterized protein n=2 Tax=Candidatus Blackburniibacteriota TaxID=1817898 RepID=A0A1G1V7J6_9BACT|nr:MAG: hypothetical protein A3F61_03120 [Candidatus Blackburnbacteria bacterium RIFCSPHIGHO2_12_FULL_41_13b]OGY14055.1 MAG: hypothetical protein A3A58_00805 [Candidatus Blackburnbacteria bacterium RIFCSPLOWO2_01_FULL_41_27]
MSLVETAVRKLKEREVSLTEQEQVRGLCVQLRQEWVPLLREYGKPVRNLSRLGEVVSYPLLIISSQIVNGLRPSQILRGLVVERQIETHAEYRLKASVYSLGKNPETSPQIVVTLEGLPQALFLFRNHGAVIPGKLDYELFNYEMSKPLIDSFGPTSLEDIVGFKEEILNPLKRRLGTPTR